MKYNLLSLMTPISLIGIAFLVYSLGTSIVFISFSQQLQLSYLIALICFMPIGFMLIPHTLSLKYGLYSKETDVVFHWQSYLYLALLIFLVNHYFLKSDEYFHQMVISMCEEFLFRFVIYKVLRNNYSRLWSIIIASLLFGILLHLNYPMIDNLLIRTPLGILFSILATKFGLEYAIGGHWIYNLYQSII
jgi:predicted metal-dependent membrane protease